MASVAANQTESTSSNLQPKPARGINLFLFLFQQFPLLKSKIKELRQRIQELLHRIRELELLVQRQKDQITELKEEKVRLENDNDAATIPDGASTFPSESATSEPSDRTASREKQLQEQLEEQLVLVGELTETITELKQRAAKDSSNSSKPPSSDGLKKKNATVNGQPKRQCEKKPLGGQPGHQGRTMEQCSHPDHHEDRYPDVCPHCGETLDSDTEWDSTCEKRQVLDENEANRQLEYTEYRAHSCSCPKCGKRVKAAFPKGVDGPIQFGPILTAKVIYLRVAQFLPERRVVDLRRVLLKVDLSSATVKKMCQRAAKLIAQVLQELERQVAQGTETKHRDETGFRIGGRLWWLHVMSTLTLTCYRISPTRGAMFESLQGRVVHDCMPSYAKLTDLIHGYCNAHLLRELQAVMEPGEIWAQKMHRFLLLLERYVRRAKYRAAQAGNRGSPFVSEEIWEKIDRRYGELLALAITYHEENPLVSSRKRGRKKRRPGHNLALRLQSKKEDFLRFVRDWNIPFTNNLAERDLRMMKLCMKIFGCFRTEAGARDFVARYSVISTAKKRGWEIVETLVLSAKELAVKLQAA